MAEWIQVTRDLMIALVGGLVGAAGGAWGAQAIAESSARRKERITELRNVNALIQVTSSACNTVLVYRKQFSIDLLSKLTAAQDGYQRRLNSEYPDLTPFHLEMNLQKFPVPLIPIKRMEDILFGKISTIGRELSVMQQIELALQGLIEITEERTKLISLFAEGAIPSDVVPFMYLGIKQENGITNESYPSSVKGMDQYAKDLAFFIHLLCEDLVGYGIRLRAKIIEESNFLDGKVPEVSEIDFKSALSSGLLPKPEDYHSWLKGFIDKKVDK